MVDRDERIAITEIEKVRKSLERNRQCIEIQDFGAVSPNSKRFDEGLGGGVIKQQEIGEICKNASKNQFWCSFLFHLIRQFRPNQCIEMGTCLGISASYISSALRLNGSGRLVTLEGSPPQAEIARATFRQLGLDNVSVRVGAFKETLVPVLEKLKPVNFIFVDGHHDEAATCLYFDIIRQYLDSENILIFDDIKWSQGMKGAWQYVENQSDAYDLGSVGLCVNVSAVGN